MTITLLSRAYALPADLPALGVAVLPAVVVMVVFGIATVTDLRARRVPLWLTMSAIAGALVVALLEGAAPASLVGLGVGVVVLLPFVLLGGIGGGDALLLGVVGAWLGWHYVLLTVWWGALAGGVLALIALARKQRTFPYVPALALGALLAPLSLR